jgi:hypothetical protein
MADTQLGLHSYDVLADIQRIWKAKQSKNTGCELKKYGGLDDILKVSVVIPLYGRYDFMQHQLHNFSSDPFMKEVEIIYEKKPRGQVEPDPNYTTSMVMCTVFSNP